TILLLVVSITVVAGSMLASQKIAIRRSGLLFDQNQLLQDIDAGHQLAVTAGLDCASGRAVVTLDGDCQHPPELINEFVARWREGFEVVGTVRKDAGGASVSPKGPGRLTCRLVSLLTGVAAEKSDFRLLDRKVVDAVRGARERSRFLRGLIRWMGFRQAAVEYEPAPRQAGTPSYTLGKLARMGSAGVFNFSVLPLRLIGIGGTLMAGAAAIYAVVALILWGFIGASQLANLVMLAIGLTGLQLGALGLTAEYIGRIYDQAKGRPIYVIREAVGFEDLTDQPPAPTEPARTAPTIEPSRIRLFT
ncbi:hypothetical protein LCGC14_2530990, partial [marine sediment metagenome]